MKRISLLPIILGLTSASALAESGSATQPADLPAEILPTGTSQRELRAYLMSLVRPFQTPHSSAEWEKQSAALRTRTLDEVIFRGVPKSWRTGPTRIEWGSTIPGKGYTIRKLRYEVVPGLWVGALLYEPEDAKAKTAAVLDVNGHEPTGMFTDYVQARSINLVKRGINVLALEWIGVGQLLKPGYDHDEQGYLDLCGVAGVSVMYLELQRGLDVLLGRPHVDAERVAVTGLSGGGWQTILISSLDTRVKFCAPNAGYSGIESRILNPPNMGDYEQCPPDLAAVSDYTYLTAMLAPRAALLIYNDKDQCCYRADTCKPSVYDPIVPVYEIFGHPDRFTIHINSDPGTHNYLQDNRQAFYRALHQHLVPDASWSDGDIPCENEILKREQLEIEYPADNADYHSVAKEFMKNLPAPKTNRQIDGDAREARNRDWRGELKEVLRMEPVLTARAEPIAPVSQPADLDAKQENFALKLGDRWTLPVVTFTRSNTTAGVDIVLADEGRARLPLALLAASLREGRRVLIVDLLLMGECKKVDAAPYLWTLIIGTLGHRPLAIQTEQLAAVAGWTQDQFAHEPLRLVAQGLNASMVALTLAALDPQRFEHIELHGLEPSFKRFIDAGVTFKSAPPVFCPSLFKTADIPDLVKLAGPTQVVFK